MRPLYLIANEQQRKDPTVDAFVAALRRSSGTSIELVTDATSTDSLLLSWNWNVADLDPAIARRMLLLNAPLAAGVMFEHLERGGFAGAVPMTLWRPDKPIDMHLAGLRTVVHRLKGKTPVEGRYASEHYCYYTQSPAPLEQGIIEYLDALDRELDNT